MMTQTPPICLANQTTTKPAKRRKKKWNSNLKKTKRSGVRRSMKRFKKWIQNSMMQRKRTAVRVVICSMKLQRLSKVIKIYSNLNQRLKILVQKSPRKRTQNSLRKILKKKWKKRRTLRKIWCQILTLQNLQMMRSHLCPKNNSRLWRRKSLQWRKHKMLWNSKLRSKKNKKLGINLKKKSVSYKTKSRARKTKEKPRTKLNKSNLEKLTNKSQKKGKNRRQKRQLCLRNS